MPIYKGSSTINLESTTHSHTLSDITDAGTAAASNTGDFEASGAVSTHAAITSGVHGISAFGATLVDDADAATARTTLGLGTAATSNTGDFAATVHTHTLSQITDAGTAAASNTGDFAAASHTHTVSQITDLSDPVTSPSQVLATLTDISAGTITGVVKLTQAEYDDIASPVSTILYVIV